MQVWKTLRLGKSAAFAVAAAVLAVWAREWWLSVNDEVISVITCSSSESCLLTVRKAACRAFVNDLNNQIHDSDVAVVNWFPQRLLNLQHPRQASESRMFWGHGIRPTLIQVMLYRAAWKSLGGLDAEFCPKTLGLSSRVTWEGSLMMKSSWWGLLIAYRKMRTSLAGERRHLQAN